MSAQESSIITPSDLNALEELTAREHAVLICVEQFWWTNRKLMTPEQCAEFTGADLKFVQNTWKKPTFQHALRAKGMVSDRIFEKVLTEKQILTANMVANRYDTRSTREKLKEAGVTVSQFAAWKADKTFYDYLTKKVGADFSTLRHSAMNNLAQAIEDGDMTATRMLLEIEGIVQNKASLDINVNVNVLLEQLIEVILPYVPQEKWEELGANIERLAMLHSSRSNPIEVLGLSAPVSV